jgi:hypothetical protein
MVEESDCCIVAQSSPGGRQLGQLVTRSTSRSRLTVHQRPPGVSISIRSTTFHLHAETTGELEQPRELLR